MTIQRKYSLPNCTLLLEGLGISNNEEPAKKDVRPVLSVLVNAECHFPPVSAPLIGGRDFFEGLVRTVSNYAQECLSQVRHPEHRQTAGVVQLKKLDNNRHRLTVQPAKAEEIELDVGNNSAADPVEIDLTTVQLFDLVEAVDQFFADSQTLPDLSLQLTPVSKRYARSGQQLAKQAVPATVGMSSLALAAIAFFLVPVPEVRPPEPKPQSQSAESGELATAPPITEPSQLVALNQQLYDKLQPAWQPQPTLSEDLIYRVGVSADGAIRGYTAANEAANAQVKQTPLPGLLAPLNPDNAAPPAPLAQFEVVFSPTGDLQVRPWKK